MSPGDRITIIVAAGAISATLAVGTCSTNARIGDVNARIGDVNARIDGVSSQLNTRIDDMNAQLNARIDGVSSQLNTRIDDMNARFEARFDDVQEEIRELRALIVDFIKRAESADRFPTTTHAPDASYSSLTPITNSDA